MANTDDFSALARRYWDMWGETLRGGMPDAGMAGTDGFRAALDAWAGKATGSGGFDAVLGHFNNQGKQWYAQMQQVAAQFAGQQHSAHDVAQAWKQALGAAGNPFQSLLQGMRGPGLEGMDQWNRAVAPWLHGLNAETGELLGMPAFGFTREQQERMQALVQAQLRWQDAFANYNTLMAQVSQDAFSRFESKLAEREEPGRQIGSVRALFDLWVDAAEEAYAQAALSVEYRRAFGELVNAQMQARARLQAIVEHTVGLMGLPGRTELDSAHRKIAELERQLRRMQRGDAAPSPTKPAPARREAATPAPAKKAAKPVAKKAAKPAKKAAKVVKKVAKKAVKPTRRKR
ncbi:MAG: class III poly(R)-hydroxyalkanoic acid synthase subunit PhaE [Thermomonas sp.]|uniref:class III poly(R)-hydroxyalkanoic acid synthase subunit PhaE n=1 Tax=Thermomonas sp. TaxID=1971895 RepID=UPI0039E3F9D5